MPLNLPPGAGTGDMLANNNLSELASRRAAQRNLGLGLADKDSWLFARSHREVSANEWSPLTNVSVTFTNAATTSNATTNISGSVWIPYTDPRLTIYGDYITNPSTWFTSVPFIIARGPLSANSSGRLALEFVVSGTAFEIFIYQPNFRMWVDGKLMTLTRQPAGVTYTYPCAMLKVTFASAATRRIRIEGLSLCFAGLRVENSSSLYSIRDEKRPLMLALADSLGEGTGANDPYLGYLSRLCEKYKWAFFNSSSGGTGYTTDGGIPGRYKYIDRVATDVESVNPDVVVISGSQNDGGATTEAQAGELYDAIRAAAPRAKIIVIGPMWKTTPPYATEPANTNIRAACAARGILFIDTLISGFEWFQASDYTTFFGGVRATATASVSGGLVTGIAVNNAGSGYGYAAGPTVSFSGGGGTGATAVANLALTCTALSLIRRGKGYTTAPTVQFFGGGSGATATATVSGGAVQAAFTITNGGEGYLTAPTVTITGDGTGATATATVVDGVVTAITRTAAGTGYTTATVTISGATMPTATATVAGGEVTALTLNTAGSGFQSPLRVVLSGGGGVGAKAAPYLSGTVASITVTNAGTGYATAPTVTLQAAGDTAHPAQAGHDHFAELVAEAILASVTP